MVEAHLNYVKSIRQHYKQCWDRTSAVMCWNKGPTHELPPEFCVLRLPPRPAKAMWTYATCGMSLSSDPEPLELHVFAPVQCDEELVELLTVVAHYHRTGSFLHLGDTVNFGRGWIDNSNCDHGLISLPYLDGPELEWLDTDETKVRFLWLIPVTTTEVEYKRKFGLESLEAKMETSSFDYLNPHRPSVV